MYDWMQHTASAAAQRPALRNHGRLPLVFEPSQGQADREVNLTERACYQRPPDKL
jgi:hypothetical protein